MAVRRLRLAAVADELAGREELPLPRSLPGLEVYDTTLSELRKLLSSWLPPDDPCNRYINWQTCITP